MKYLRYPSSDCKDIGLRQFEFVTKTQFLSFEKYVPNHLIRLLYDFYFIFRRRYLVILKINSENVSTQKYDFERRLWAQTQDLQILKKFFMSQMNPKEIVHNAAYSVQLPEIAGLSL